MDAKGKEGRGSERQTIMGGKSVCFSHRSSVVLIRPEAECEKSGKPST